MASSGPGIVHTINLSKYGYEDSEINISNPYHTDELYSSEEELDEEVAVLEETLTNVISIEGKQYRDILPSLNRAQIDIVTNIITDKLRSILIGWIGENIYKIYNRIQQVLQIRNTESELISIASGIKGHPIQFFSEITINANIPSEDEFKNAKAIVNSFINGTMLPGTLFLRSNRSGGGHQNAFVVDWKNYTIIRFEPFGKAGYFVCKYNDLSEKDIKKALMDHLIINDEIKEEIVTILDTHKLTLKDIEKSINGLKFYSTGSHGLCGAICGLFSKGKNQVQKMNVGDKNCQLYSLYYLLLMLVNQDIKDFTIISKINSVVHAQPYKKDLLYLLIYDLFKEEIDIRRSMYEGFGKKHSKKNKRIKRNLSKKKHINKKKQKLSKKKGKKTKRNKHKK